MRQKASLAAVLLAVVLMAGGAGVLAYRAARAFERNQAMAADLAAQVAGLATHIDRLSDEIRFSAPVDLGHKHDEVREFVVRSKIAQKPDAILVVGDSITEAAFLPASICGHSVINAGLGGADVESYLAFARLTFPANLKSPLIVVALGTNNSTSIGAKWDSPLAPSYDRLADFLQLHADKLLFAGIPPIEMSGALAKGYFDADFSRKNDAAIRSVALSRSVDFIDLRAALVGQDLTVDGIHLTPAGYREWLPAIVNAAEKTLDCRTVQN
jgi:lysophospholipase L1-like esterase/outer membrane murein-binding lipoprotein Lpp